MTLAVVGVTTPADSGSLIPKWTQFNAQTPAAIAKAFSVPDVSVVATTTTNDSDVVLTLSDYFTFSSGVYYPVTLRHYAQTENDRYFQELEYLVIGSTTAGTDPVVIGDGAMATGVQGKIKRAFGVLAGAAQAYGRVSYNGVLDVEATDGTNSHGVAAGAGSSGVYALTLPLSRTARVIGVHVEQETFAAAEAAYGVVEDLTAIRVVQADDGTGATNATASTNITATLDLYPPVNAFLVVNGTPDPGTVQVYVLGISSDEVRHRVDVFVGDPIDASFYGS